MASYSYQDALLNACRESYARDRCTLEEVDAVLDHILRFDFPIPDELVYIVSAAVDGYGRVLVLPPGWTYHAIETDLELR